MPAAVNCPPGIPKAPHPNARRQRTGPPGPLPLILPIIRALEVGQAHRQIRRIVREWRVRPKALFHWMDHTPVLTGLFLWLIQRIQKQDQEGHVIGQTESGKLAVTLSKRAAEAAVCTLIPLTLILR